MALKPFYNKKGHLGMTRQQVKDALAKADAINIPAEFIGDIINNSVYYSKENAVTTDTTVELTEAQTNSLFNGDSVTISNFNQIGSYKQPWHIILNGTTMGMPLGLILNLTAISPNSGDSNVIYYTGIFEYLDLVYITANVDTVNLTLTLKGTTF